MKKKWNQLPRWVKIISWLLIFLIIAEIILRYTLGLGDIVLYREDAEYEYFYEPNQDVWRYGNNIVTNELGMRSKPISKKKKIKILLFGDSVLNGGSHIDQKELVSTTLESELSNQFKNLVQVLNISAQSWGPSNAFAFLKKHGDFDSKIIVLVFSSHDWNDNMHFKKVVGHHPAWPSNKPYLAITDAWSRLVWPAIKQIFTDEGEYDYLIDFNDYVINPGWSDFMDYCQKRDIKLIVYLHATKSEITKGSYNKQGAAISRFCKRNNVYLIKDISSFTDMETQFKDEIHLLGKGHETLFSLLFPVLQKSIVQKYPELENR